MTCKDSDGDGWHGGYIKIGSSSTRYCTRSFGHTHQHPNVPFFDSVKQPTIPEIPEQLKGYVTFKNYAGKRYAYVGKKGTFSVAEVTKPKLSINNIKMQPVF